ncbi:hypothetical protein EC957_011544 [Mortierella hygrophila]|uniref:Uncharacterized protein n=1 Tax=Mortierella hygrophila TaxID=979708 RepID=A0A9P6K443_9FUNG|nr:hypothetical protein EC957_011544 [Mortierella hygrophila]
MTLTVLTECVHLEGLRAFHIDVPDFRSEKLTGRDWACSGLRNLKVQIFRDMDDVGADQLCLTHVSFYNTRQGIGTEDIWAIPENWTSLKKMYGVLSEDPGAPS